MVWDVAQPTGTPSLELTGHDAEVTSISWHSFDENVLVSSADDRKLLFWDIRQQQPTHTLEAHGEEINTVDFNKHNECLLASGSRDKTVAIWDRRNLTTKLMSLDYHEN
jgi:histone-binding protein RBBP4